jgi:hypothetical protein
MFLILFVLPTFTFAEAKGLCEQNLLSNGKLVPITTTVKKKVNPPKKAGVQYRCQKQGKGYVLQVKGSCAGVVMVTTTGLSKEVRKGKSENGNCTYQFKRVDKKAIPLASLEVWGRQTWEVPTCHYVDGKLRRTSAFSKTYYYSAGREVFNGCNKQSDWRSLEKGKIIDNNKDSFLRQ